MEETTTTAQSKSEQKQRSPQLVRPVEGRMLAGVAKGIADNFGISEWIPRLVFVITTFMGGLGIALYAAGWAFIRSEDETESPAERFFSGASGARSWIGIAFIVLAAVIVLDNFTILSGSVVWAGVLLVLGLLLYMGYLPGNDGAEKRSDDSKEGVQRMNTTDTLVSDTKAELSGDSPAGGSVTPPPPPTPTPPQLPPARQRETSFLGRLTIGAVMIGLGTLAILDNIDSLAIDAQPRHYVALAVTIIGIGLLVGGFIGRARWLIIVAAVLIPTLIFSPAFEYDWSTDSFDARIAPTTFEELQTSYQADIGQMRIDLTQLDWNGQVVDLSADLDMGQLTIVVPDEVGLYGEADVNIGSVTAEHRSSAGVGNPTLEFSETGTQGEIHLDAHVDAGDITIVTR